MVHRPKGFSIFSWLNQHGLARAFLDAVSVQFEVFARVNLMVGLNGGLIH